MSTLPLVYPSVVHMLAAAVQAAPGREAVVCGNERLSYREYHACVAGFANELVAAGCRGERVAMLMANSPDLCVAMFGIHAAGARAVPLNPIYTRHELEPIVADCTPRAVIYDEAARAVVEPIAESLGIAVRICIGGEGGRRLLGWRDERALTLPEPLPAPADLATLQYTGGTTGRAKGAMLSHYNICVNISQREALAPTRRDGERILAVLPLFHVYGVSMCLHNAAYCQGTLVMVGKYRPDTVVEALVHDGITILGGSPTLFSGLLGYEGMAGKRFPELRLSYSGGAPLPEGVLRRWEQTTGTAIFEGYGMSEAGPVITYTPLAGPRKVGAVGPPMPACEVQIVDTETGTRVLPAGELGEIRVRGPQIMSGYWNNPAETAHALREGWLYTGDIGEFDADGYLYIRDRKKDMVLVGGYNVYPREVEEVLYGHPAVREVAVVGVPDAYRGELVKACVVLRDAAAATTDELTAHCAANLARYKIPAIVELVAELPKTGAGKIDKKQLRSA
ncbi:MAG: long-chain fatty acid--CoA ligase [Gammaproteobacteria bacterium]|nr:long-chain fatty acid--CoA ligase [Gammaproteobacteria bacterium]